MTDAQIAEAKRSTASGLADSETQKKVFIACIHRPGFDSCVPHDLISGKTGGGSFRDLSNYNLQRNWPVLKIIGCFESKKDARAAVNDSFYEMKTEGVVEPREFLYKMRFESYPYVAHRAIDEDEYDESDDSDDLNDDKYDIFDRRISYREACKYVKLEGRPTLWSIFPFDMHLTLWALSEVFVVSGQYNWDSTFHGGDEEIKIHGVFRGAVEARAAVDLQQKETEDIILQDFSESDRDDEPASGEFPSMFLIPEKDIFENWRANGTGCISYHVQPYHGGHYGVDRASLRVQKVSNVPVSKPMKLLAAIKSFLDTLVWLQLCNAQGVALFPFVRLPPRVRHPFADGRVHSMSLTHVERLRVVGCGFKGELVRLLSLGKGRHVELQRISGACHKMMQGIARRVAAGLAAPAHTKSQSKKRARRNH